MMAKMATQGMMNQGTGCIQVERTPDRVVFTWPYMAKPVSTWALGVIAIIVGMTITDELIESLSFTIFLFVVIMVYTAIYFYIARYGKRRLEISTDALHLCRHIFGRRKEQECIPLREMMGAKAHCLFGFWCVHLMVPGRPSGVSIGYFRTQEETEFIAGEIESASLYTGDNPDQGSMD